jgi:hypothetical protein
VNVASWVIAICAEHPPWCRRKHEHLAGQTITRSPPRRAASEDGATTSYDRVECRLKLTVGNAQPGCHGNAAERVPANASFGRHAVLSRYNHHLVCSTQK